MAGKSPQLGVLALQGAFREHGRMLEALGAEVRYVRMPSDLVDLSGLVLPGGESSSMRHLLAAAKLREPILEFAQNGGALFGTCAGAILLAKRIEGDSAQSLPPALNVMDFTAQRNAYGRQFESFNANLLLKENEDLPFSAPFIRAPAFAGVGPSVEVLATHDGRPVLLREGRMLAAAFHPELGSDDRIHKMFLEMLP